MSEKLIYLISFVLVLGLILTSAANAADPSLVGYWRFDEGSGTTASDSSGYGNDGTIVNAQWDTGHLGSALNFGGNAYVEIPPEAWSPIERQVTIAFWAYGDPDRLPAQNWAFAAMVDRDTNASRVASCHLPWGDGQIFFDTGWTQESTYNRINKAATPEEYEGSWQHWAFTKDADTGEQKIHLNGVLWHSGSGMTKTMRGVTAFTIACRCNHTLFYIGRIDDFQLYNRALTEAEIQEIMQGVSILPPGLASNPKPADGATDVPRDVVLSWTPGEFANTHDVYFGTNFIDVNDAGRTNPRGVLVSQGQAAATYDPPGRLDFGQPYYWRIDEVNAPPTSTIYKGSVWSFTVEPLAYPINADSITATASSSNSAAEGPENTINGSGLNASNLHSAANTDMWLSSMTGAQPTSIQYEFDRAYKLHQMLVWNHNSSVEPVIGFGTKEATIEYSADGANWTTLGTTHEFARGPGAAGYAANTTVDLGGVAAKYVKITANSNWGGIVSQFGLSEVRFLSIPVLAREPNPVSGATDIGVDATLSWKAGREAAKHNVYLSADEQAVIDGTAPVVTATSPSYASSLDLAGTYYWRVDEVNDVETPTAWQGDVWSLSTQEYLVVDDFESYNDIETGQEGSNLVYMTWVDGFGTTTNGSTIGYFEAFQPSMEKTLVYDGRQSVPLFYNNTTAGFSEITANVADLQAGRDWAKHGIKGLTLQFRGDPDNVLQQMYVKINSAKVTYDGSAENIRLKGWQMWYIDLASLGVSLSNVTKLTIGFERIGTLGGQGVVLLDGIRLYSYDRQLITPIDPGTAALQAQYPFEGNANDSSGKGRNGSGVGNPTFAAGKIGQAINLTGSNYVEITGYKGVLGGHAFSIAAWVKSTSTGDATIVCWGASTNGQRVDFRLGAGRLRVEHGNGNLLGNTTVADDQWHHVTLTVTENASISYPAVRLYLDGNDDSQTTTDPDTFNIVASVDVNIGRRGTHNDRSFQGLIDDARIYDRVLTQEEIAWLAGRVRPFDKPF